MHRLLRHGRWPARITTRRQTRSSSPRSAQHLSAPPRTFTRGHRRVRRHRRPARMEHQCRVFDHDRRRPDLFVCNSSPCSRGDFRGQLPSSPGVGRASARRTGSRATPVLYRNDGAGTSATSTASGVQGANADPAGRWPRPWAWSSSTRRAGDRLFVANDTVRKFCSCNTGHATALREVGAVRCGLQQRRTATAPWASTRPRYRADGALGRIGRHFATR